MPSLLSSENEVTIASTALRNNLSETERLLNKFSESIRRKLVLDAKQSTPNTETIFGMIELLSKMQADFSKFKSSADILLALFEQLPQQLSE